MKTLGSPEIIAARITGLLYKLEEDFQLSGDKAVRCVQYVVDFIGSDDDVEVDECGLHDIAKQYMELLEGIRKEVK